MHKTCPSCGRRESGELAFARAFCIDCYSKRENLFEVPKAELKRCTRCGRSFVSGKWKDFSDSEIGKWAASKIKSRLPVSVKSVSLRSVKGGLLVSADIELDADGTAISKRAGVPVSMPKVLCSDCHKKSGGYREAVIQLRGGTPERLRKMAEKLVGELEAGSYVSDYDEHKNGIDFSVGSRSLALRIVGRLGRHYTRSNTLIGQKEGTRIYRTTLCVRLD